MLLAQILNGRFAASAHKGSASWECVVNQTGIETLLQEGGRPAGNYSRQSRNERKPTGRLVSEIVPQIVP
jgi:hypothetical protein